MLTTTLTAGILPEIPALAAPPSSPPNVPASKSVPVGRVAPTPRPAGAQVSQWKPAGRTLPPGGAAVVPVAAADAAATAAGPVSVGGLPVAVRAAAAADPRTATDVRRALSAQPAGAPTSVRLEVAAASAASKAGLAGVLFTLSPASGGSVGDRVDVDVDYSGFKDLFGANFGARLRLVSLPACALTTPQVPECRAQVSVAGAFNNENKSLVSATGLVVGPGSSTSASPAAGAAATGSAGGGSALAAPPAGHAIPDGQVKGWKPSTTVGSPGPSPTAAPTSGGRVYALASTDSSAAGNYRATSLSPTYSWAAGGQGGDFTYSYPFHVPASLGGPAPQLTLQYSSGSVDGRTTAANGQASWVGEGWDMQTGYIERTYKPCADDGQNTGDLCAYSEKNATLVMGGKSTRLVKDDATGTWHSEADDGWKVDQLFDTTLVNGDYFGEYWQLTDPSGTKYQFGRNKRFNGDGDTNSVQHVLVYGNNPGEPCYNSVHAYWSGCDRGYRWNLDYVMDPRGNSMTYFYSKYAGKYGNWNGSDTRVYDLSARLDHIDYGTRTGQEASGSAPVRVEFPLATRCTGDGCTVWPDVPWDKYCGVSATSCATTSPIFFNPYKLASVNTRVWNAAANGYQDVDRYTMATSWPDPGDGTAASLWLDSITHTGVSGTGSTATAPVVSFDKTWMDNRLDWVPNQVPPLRHYRIGGVNNGTGEHLGVDYSTKQCDASTPPAWDNNALRCFAQYFSPAPGNYGIGYFNKYVVLDVVASDTTGGSPGEVWYYDYSTTHSTSAALWHFDENEVTDVSHRMWTDWRGYTDVKVTHGPVSGPQTVTTSLYYRGMDADRVGSTDNARSAAINDSKGGALLDQEPLRGFVRETDQLNPGSHAATVTLHSPTLIKTGTRSAPWTSGTFSSNILREWATENYTWIQANNAERHTQVTRSFDGYGLPVDVHDSGDVATNADDRCTHTDYARNTGAYLIDFPAHVLTTDCASTPGDGDYLAGTQNFYDWTTTVGASHNEGFLTKTTALAGVASGAMTWKQTGRTDYDGYGRPTATYDALERKTTTAYTPATGGPVTSTAATNPAGWTTTTTLDPGLGVPTQVVDPNGKTTNEAYDPLGRLTAVWLANRPTSATPDLAYTYTLQSGAASWVQTQKLGPAGQQIASYTIYDGRMRPRQTQTPAPQAVGGRVITDTSYDGRGLTAKTSTFWNNASGPAGTLVAFNDADVVNQHRYSYDNLERVTADALYSNNALKWQTTTAYDGDRIIVTPPDGGTPTTTIGNARGKTTTLRQYLGGQPSGTYQDTTYTYDRLDRQTGITDPAGNKWTTSYDLRGRVTQATDPDKGTTTSTYDDAGELTTSKDARGVLLAYKYDNLGRNTELWQNAIGTGNRLADWTYDSLDNGTILKGQPATATRYNGTDAYTTIVTGYDDAYRPLGTTVRIPAAETGLAGDWTTSTTYNVDGSPATVTYPAAAGLGTETVTTAYDNIGLPVTLAGLDTYVAATQYYYWGTVKQQLLGTAPKQVKLTTGTDEATGRLTQLSTSIQADATTFAEKLTENYSYNPAGQVTSTAETNVGNTVSNQCFTYDGLQQLTEAWTTIATTCQASPTQTAVGGPDSYWTSYRYDNVGNRTSDTTHDPAGDTTRTYTYPAAGAARPHAVTSVAITGATTGNNTYGYDQTGNTATRNVGSKPGQTLTWSTLGQLKTVNDGTNTSSYFYDADGKRLIARDSTGTTLYLGGTEVHRDTAGAISATRFYGSTAVRTDPGGLTWLAADNHATGELAINAGDLTVTRRKTDPFGNPRGTQTAWPTTHGYVNGVTDPTGLTHLGAREYDPTIGRFISVDPILDTADPLQMNGYNYADSNPGTASDPSGLRSCSDPIDCAGDPSKGRPAPNCLVCGNPPLPSSPSGNSSGGNKDKGCGPNPFCYIKKGVNWVDDKIKCAASVVCPGKSTNYDTNGDGRVTVGDLAGKEWQSNCSQMDAKAAAICSGVTSGIVGIVDSYADATTAAGQIQGCLESGSAADCGMAVVVIASGAEGEDAAAVGKVAGVTRAAKAAHASELVVYDSNVALGQLTRNGTAKASDLVAFGRSQGWTQTRTANGPIKFVDENGIARLTIKRGSPRAPGSGFPHIEVRNASGQRVDPFGNLITRNSPSNHVPIEYDLP